MNGPNLKALLFLYFRARGRSECLRSQQQLQLQWHRGRLLQGGPLGPGSPTSQSTFGSWESRHQDSEWFYEMRLVFWINSVSPVFVKNHNELPWFLTTMLQSKMSAKLSQQRFWHCCENGLIKTIQKIPHNLYVSVKLTSLYYGLRLILVYPNPQ